MPEDTASAKKALCLEVRIAKFTLKKFSVIFTERFVCFYTKLYPLLKI